MKFRTLLFLSQLFFLTGICQNKRSASMYIVPDSVKATGFYSEIMLPFTTDSKKNISGISADGATVRLGYNKRQKNIQFGFFGKSRNEVASGADVYPFGTGSAWDFDWNYNETYPMLILSASDSAMHSTIYSGYTYLATEKKWKLISTCSHNDTVTIKYIKPGNKVRNKSGTTYSNSWILRRNSTWIAMDSLDLKSPVLRPMSNIDSLAQQKLEEAELTAKLPADSVSYKKGIFYQSITAGTGKLALLTDTVTVHYKGWLFSNGLVFDETKGQPISFPLNRLIAGWQLGITECKVGGKIRLFIPSGIAYGIRTFSPKIPPNSILVFDVEVLEAREKIDK